MKSQAPQKKAATGKNGSSHQDSRSRAGVTRAVQAEAATPSPKPRPEYQALLAKREEMRDHLGMRFDMLAGMGRVAEDDQALLSHEEFLSLDRNHRDYEQLRLIEEALERLQSGEYGICEDCQEPIPGKRLQAIPWAKYCVRCQEKNQQREQWDQHLDLMPIDL